jgi:hypothetical protein
MYCDYPEVNDSDRLTHAQTIDPSRVSLGPGEAWAQLKTPGVPDDVALEMFDGRPAYWFHLGRAQAAVYADNGQVQKQFPPELNLRTAAAWAGQSPAGARVEPVTAVDQWTVGGVYTRYRPLTKYSWPNGDEVYVSRVSGRVVQATTRSSRLGAWLGPIPHWLYFTPLRKNGKLWSSIVIWLSGIATVVAVLGLFVGLSLYLPSGRIGYAGAKRLHMILGLFFGFLACTWSFSGMLSMDPFPQKSPADSAASSHIADALSGDPFAFEPFAGKIPLDALTNAKRVEFLIVGGRPIWLVREDARHSRMTPGIDVMELVKNTGGVAETRLINSYDAYYLDRNNELPLPALLVRVSDSQQTRFYIDPKTARIVGSYSSASFAERWLYHGFHSMNLPWLYNHRPAWDIVVLTLMLGGTSLCITSVIIGWKLMRRKLIRA